MNRGSFLATSRQSWKVVWGFFVVPGLGLVFVVTLFEGLWPVRDHIAGVLLSLVSTIIPATLAWAIHGEMLILRAPEFY